MGIRTGRPKKPLKITEEDRDKLLNIALRAKSAHAILEAGLHSLHLARRLFSTFVARVDGRAEDRVAVIRDAIQSVDRLVPVFGAMTMEQRLDDALARPQFYWNPSLVVPLVSHCCWP
jgi:nitroreductase